MKSSRRFRRVVVALQLIGAMLLAIAYIPSATARTARAVDRRDAHVVVAVLEESFNPYHNEFSRPALDAHPSRYLPGYPRSAQPLELSLAETDFSRALAADRAKFSAVKPGQLYYLPGTNFVGAVHIPGHPLDRGGSIPPEGEEPFINSRFHGTGVTSVLGGKTTGSCPECLIVVVAADDAVAGLEWAGRQPWIDIISNSWGGIMSTPVGTSFTEPTRTPSEIAAVSRAAAASGKILVWGSGNGLTGSGGIVPEVPQHGLTIDGPFTGPPWVLTVGAARTNGQPTPWHDIPVDVISHGEQWPRARDDSTRGKGLFLGTSCAAPVAAGTIASALLETRRAVDDYGVGSRGGSLVVPAPGIALSGPLKDGRLTRAEAVDAAKHAADWAQPALPGTFVTQGYGLLNKDSIPSLVDLFVGRKPIEADPDVDPWAQQMHGIRTALWGQEP